MQSFSYRSEVLEFPLGMEISRHGSLRLEFSLLFPVIKKNEIIETVLCSACYRRGFPIDLLLDKTINARFLSDAPKPLYYSWLMLHSFSCDNPYNTVIKLW